MLFRIRKKLKKKFLQKNENDFLRFHSFTSYFLQKLKIPENFLLAEILDI